jgi:hypothetical protein
VLEFLTLLVSIIRALLQGVVMALSMILCWLLVARAFGWQGSLW